MPRSAEIAHYSQLLADLQISLVRVLVAGDAALVCEVRRALAEAYAEIWTLLSHDALMGRVDLDRSLLDVAVERGLVEEAKV